MTVREIRLFGDPVLRTVCEPVVEIDDRVRSLVTDLLDTVAFDGRAGLAATQIGFTQRAFSLNIDGEISYLLNPEIVELSGEPVPTGEGCLSVPELWFEVLRPTLSVCGRDRLCLPIPTPRSRVAHPQHLTCSDRPHRAPHQSWQRLASAL